jgi:hypothetical protein
MQTTDFLLISLNSQILKIFIVRMVDIGDIADHHCLNFLSHACVFLCPLKSSDMNMLSLSSNMVTSTSLVNQFEFEFWCLNATFSNISAISW